MTDYLEIMHITFHDDSFIRIFMDMDGVLYAFDGLVVGTPDFRQSDHISLDIVEEWVKSKETKGILWIIPPITF